MNIVSQETPNQAEIPETTEPVRRTDFWLDMHKGTIESEKKRRDFVEDILMFAEFDPLIIDALMMLCETFKNAADKGGTTVHDIADSFQAELFRHTTIFSAASDGYLAHLKKGVKSYHFEDEKESKIEQLYEVGLHISSLIERREPAAD